MKRHLTLFLSVFLMTTVSFSLFAQSANFTQGCLPLEVTFSGPAGQAAYFWDFKDGATATSQNPTNTFGEAGTYEVELREGQNGTLVGTLTISVFEKPTISITAAPPSGCAPETINFQSVIIKADAITVNNYEWVFGDTETGTGESTTHFYANPGSYNITLDISTNLPGCNNTAFFQDFITLTESFEVSYSTDPATPVSCTAPLTVNFQNTTSAPGVSFQWDFGNGQTSNQTNPGPITYSEEGLFTVTLTGTGDNGCTKIATSTVSVGPPTAAFNANNPPCINNPVTFLNASTTGTYNWDFGPNASPMTSNALNPEVIFNTAGEQTITLEIITTEGCSNSITQTIEVEALPEGFTTLPDFTCAEPLLLQLTPAFLTAAEYSWSITAISGPATGEVLFSSEEQSPTFEFNNLDETIFSKNGALIISTSYFAESENGCSVQGQMVDTLWQPNALFMPDVVDGCAPLVVTFSDSSASFSPIVSYTYLYGDGNMASFTNDNEHSYTFETPGEYDVTLVIENENGCRDTSYAVRIEVGNTITPDFSADQTTVCPGDSVRFVDITNNDNIDAWHFSAEEGRSFHCFQESELLYGFDNTVGPQDITLQVEYNGCFSEVTKTDFITVNGPIARLDYEVDCENPFNITFRDSSLDATSLVWDFGDSTSSTIADLTHLYDTTGEYTVFLTATNDMSGCPASMDSAMVYVKDIKSEFVIDSFICSGTDVMLDGSMAQDVDNRCWKGYDWHFSFDRPITTADTMTSKMFGPPGDHTVELVVTDINGCRDTSSQDVWVFRNNTDFTFNMDTICIPSEQIVFTDMTTTDTTLVSWEWDFGDMNMSTDQNTTHLYNQSPFPPGPIPPPVITTISVTLKTEDILGCPGEVTKGITVYEPSVEIIALPPGICVGDEIDFSAGDFIINDEVSPLTYNWNFGNGETSTQRMETVQYNSSGPFTVSISLEEISTGCRSMRPIEREIEVQAFPIAAITSSVDGQDPICYPAAIEFMNSSISDVPLTQQWDFGNGTTGTSPNPSVGYPKGEFTIELITSTSLGCLDTAYKDIVLVGPEGDYSVSDNQICLGEEVTFTLLDTVEISDFRWEFGDGAIQNGGEMVTYTYPNAGRFTAELILTGVNGICETTIREQIDVQLVEAMFGVLDACFGPIPFINQSSDNASIFSYNFGDGGTSNAEDPVYTFAAPGPKMVKLVAESTIGCMDSITQTITIFANPAPIVADQSGCQSTDIILTVENGNTQSDFFWTPEALVAENGNPSITVNLDETITFTVVETDGNTCEGSTMATVNIIPEIPFVNDVNQSVCDGDMFTIENIPDETGYTYRWTSNGQTAEGLSCVDCSNPIVTISESITYELVISDDNGTCDPKSATFNYILPDNVSIGLPNAFAPNGDESNDRFNIVSAVEDANINVTVFQVFDRFGNLVYDNDDPANGWDGTYDGKAALSDVYIYQVKYSIDECVDGELTGDVTLIR